MGLLVHLAAICKAPSTCGTDYSQSLDFVLTLQFYDRRVVNSCSSQTRDWSLMSEHAVCQLPEHGTIFLLFYSPHHYVQEETKKHLGFASRSQIYDHFFSVSELQDMASCLGGATWNALVAPDMFSSSSSQ